MTFERDDKVLLEVQGFTRDDRRPMSMPNYHNIFFIKNGLDIDGYDSLDLGDYIMAVVDGEIKRNGRAYIDATYVDTVDLLCIGDYVDVDVTRQGFMHKDPISHISDIETVFIKSEEKTLDDMVTVRIDDVQIRSGKIFYQGTHIKPGSEELIGLEPY